MERYDGAPGRGFTHTQYGAEHGEPDATRKDGALLSARPLPQSRHIMGWGAEYPESAPGRYDSQDLGERVALMHATGVAPVG
ncbi:hypothetical protein AB0H17_07505 [Streptomyces olivoreticuli]